MNVTDKIAWHVAQARPHIEARAAAKLRVEQAIDRIVREVVR